MAHRKLTRHKCNCGAGWLIAATAWVAVVVTPQSAWASWYGWDPSVPREHRPGNIYFGSARDVDGGYVPGVTIVLVTPEVDFVTITGPTGRFRLELPQDLRSEEVTPRCSRNGYAVGRVVKRLPLGGAQTPVQVDCLLSPVPPR